MADRAKLGIAVLKSEANEMEITIQELVKRMAQALVDHPEEVEVSEATGLDTSKFKKSMTLEIIE